MRRKGMEVSCECDIDTFSHILTHAFVIIQTFLVSVTALELVRFSCVGVFGFEWGGVICEQGTDRQMDKQIDRHKQLDNIIDKIRGLSVCLVYSSCLRNSGVLNFSGMGSS